MDNNVNNEFLKSCKACGEQISKKAKQCPNCGQDQRNFFMRHKFITGILVLMVLSLIGNLGSNNTDQANVPNNSKVEDSAENDSKEDKLVPELEVSSAQLIEDYEANEVRADEKYKDKIIQVTGDVGNIAVSMNQTYITLIHGNDFSMIDVQCFFKDEEEIDKLKDLDKGDNVTIIGKVSGQSINVGVGNCYLK